MLLLFQMKFTDGNFLVLSCLRKTSPHEGDLNLAYALRVIFNCV